MNHNLVAQARNVACEMCVYSTVLAEVVLEYSSTERVDLEIAFALRDGEIIWIG